MIVIVRWWLLVALVFSARTTAEEMGPAALLGLYLEGAARSYVVDPQDLLPEEVRAGREEFLTYHASESAIDVRVWVMAEGQSLPGGVDARFLVDGFFRDQGAVCLVVYFMGEPARAELALSEGLRRAAGDGAAVRTLQSAMMGAQERADPVGQFEAFCQQLTIRVFWIEEQAGLIEAPDADVVERPVAPVDAGASDEIAPELVRWGGRAVMVLVALGLLGFGWWMRGRHARFRFPDERVAPRLGGESGAGIGAVVHFGSTTDSPTTQRDEVPDMLGGL